MADIIDMASDREQRDLKQSLDVQRMKAASAVKLAPKGECYNPLCCDQVAAPQLYCGADCAQAHANRLRLVTR